MVSTYERFRPGYPDQLVDNVLKYAGRPVRTALEIGAGTGKATRAFAVRGIAVTATDPDAAMLAELRRHVPATVHAVHAAFEDLPHTDTYDLVFAAAALHWTDPTHRWTRVAALLIPGGVFAAFGGQLHLPDPAVEESTRAIRCQYLPDDDILTPPSTTDDTALQWPASELTASALFSDVCEKFIDRQLVMTSQDYLGHLSTISAYLQLDTAARDELLAQLLEVLPARVTLDADLTLHLARVVSL